MATDHVACSSLSRLLILLLFLGTLFIWFHRPMIPRRLMLERSGDIGRPEPAWPGERSVCFDLQTLIWTRSSPIVGEGQDQYLYTASLSSGMPLDKPIFTLLDRSVRGDVGVLGTHASTSTGIIEVLTQASFSSPSPDLKTTSAWPILGRYNVCRISRADQEGLDIRKMSREPADFDTVRFNVQLLMPSADAVGDDSQLTVPKMEIGVFNGDISVDVPGVKFRQVSLWSQQGQVYMGECDADDLTIRTGRDGPRLPL